MKLKCPRLPKGISKATLAKGIKVELEHLSGRGSADKRAAACIAKVHLTECKSYYERLDKLEKACKH